MTSGYALDNMDLFFGLIMQVRDSNFVGLIYAALAEGGAALLGASCAGELRETVNPHTCLPDLIGSGSSLFPLSVSSAC